MIIYFLEELYYMIITPYEINGQPKSLLKQTFDSFKTINKNYNGNINNKNDNDTNINNLSDKIAHNRILLDTV